MILITCFEIRNVLLKYANDFSSVIVLKHVTSEKYFEYLTKILEFFVTSIIIFTLWEDNQLFVEILFESRNISSTFMFV